MTEVYECPICGAKSLIDLAVTVRFPDGGKTVCRGNCAKTARVQADEAWAKHWAERRAELNEAVQAAEAALPEIRAQRERESIRRAIQRSRQALAAADEAEKAKEWRERGKQFAVSAREAHWAKQQADHSLEKQRPAAMSAVEAAQASVVAIPDNRFKTGKRLEFAGGTPTETVFRDQPLNAAGGAAKAALAEALERMLGRNGNGGQELSSEAAQDEQAPVDKAALLAGLKFDPSKPAVGRRQRRDAMAKLGLATEAELLVLMGFAQPQPAAVQPESAASESQAEKVASEAKPEATQLKQRQPKDKGKGGRKERIAAEKARRAAEAMAKLELVTAQLVVEVLLESNQAA